MEQSKKDICERLTKHGYQVLVEDDEYVHYCYEGTSNPLTIFWWRIEAFYKYYDENIMFGGGDLGSYPNPAYVDPEIIRGQE